MSEVRLTVNGGEHVLDVPVGTSLAHLLREELGLTGTKIACNEGHCGACTVQIDGVPRLSCITLAHTVEGEVTTIEGLRDHPLVDAFVRCDAVQCGFCTPGQVVSAAALVAANPQPTREEIRHAMAGRMASRRANVARGNRAMASWSDTYGITDELTPTPMAAASSSKLTNAGMAWRIPNGNATTIATSMANPRRSIPAVPPSAAIRWPRMMYRMKSAQLAKAKTKPRG